MSFPATNNFPYENVLNWYTYIKFLIVTNYILSGYTFFSHFSFHLFMFSSKM